jgi:hypothetical protein
MYLYFLKFTEQQVSFTQISKSVPAQLIDFQEKIILSSFDKIFDVIECG